VEFVTSDRHLVATTNLHTLLEAVGNSPLAGGGSLSESNGATERSGRSAVTDTSNADVVDTGNSSIAGHASRHLDSHGELGAGSERDTLDTKSGNVLGHLSGLEGSLVSTTGGTVDSGVEGTRTVLVDLERVRKVVYEDETLELT
jgi:hypothetical protein